MPHRLTLLVLAALLLTACGGGGSSGNLSQSLATTQADYQILDLQTGTVQAAASVPNLATDPALRDRYLVVRRLPERSALTGQATGTYAAQADEVPGQTQRPPCYIAVFELTRAQWRRIAGDEPWTTIQPAEIAGTPDDTRPACAISFVRAQAALTAYRQRGLDLRLPDDATWESAARSGGALFPWGDARDGATVAAAAVVSETAGSTAGPHPVGQRVAGAYGCYDMVGNIAEWTSDGHLRGGSWADPLALARPANLVDPETDLPYATAGLRVVFTPASR